MGRNLHLIQAFIIFNLFIHSSKGQLAPFCELPAERGPCNKLELRYRFSEETEYCQTFLYGGCEGNRNNFLTLKDCVKSCVDEISPRCELPKDPGTCFHANQVRYYFNEEKEICEKFYFSGCQGNSNNFRTAHECRQACGGFPVMDDTTTPPPQVESWVEPSQQSWYSGGGSRSTGHGSSEVTYVNPQTNRKLTFVNNHPNAPRQMHSDHNQYNSHYSNRGEASPQSASHSYHQRNTQYPPGPNNGPQTQPHRQNERIHNQAQNPHSRSNHPAQHGSGPEPQMERSHHTSRHPPANNQNNRHNNRRPNHYPKRESGPPMERNSPSTPSRRPQNRQQQTNRQNQNMRRNRHSHNQSRRNSPSGNQSPLPRRNVPYNRHQHQRNHNSRRENHPRRTAPGSFEHTPQGGPPHSQRNMPERPNYNWNRGPPTYITTTPQTREWNNWADKSNSKAYPKMQNDWDQHNSNPPSQPDRWNSQQGPPPANKWESPNKYSKNKNQNSQPHWNSKQGNPEPNNWQNNNQKPPNEWNSGPKDKPNSQYRSSTWQSQDRQQNNGGWEPRSGSQNDPNNNNSNNNKNQNNNHHNNEQLPKLDRIPIVERREFSWGEKPTRDYSNGFNEPWNSNNQWQNNPGPSQDPTHSPGNSINRQSERTNNRPANQDQHFSESMSFKRRRGPGKGKRRPLNVNNRKNGRKPGRWFRNGDRFQTDSINASEHGNTNNTGTDTWSNHVPLQHERRNTQHEQGNTQHERGNTQLGRVNTQRERGNIQHERGNRQHERANMQHERANTQHERGNTQHERANTQYERGNIHQHSQNLPPTPSNTPEWPVSQNSRSRNIGEWSNNPTVDMNPREWSNGNAPPTTPEPPNHWNLNNNIQKTIEPGPNNGKGPTSHGRPPWEQPVDNQGPGLQWLSSNSNNNNKNNNNNNNNNNQKEHKNTNNNNNKEWQNSHTNNNEIVASPTPSWNTNNKNEVVEQPFGGGPPMFEWLSKDTGTQQGNNNVNNYKSNSKPKSNTQNSQTPWSNSHSDPVPHLENFSAADIIKKQRIKPPSDNTLPMAQDPSTTLQPRNNTWARFDSNGAYVVPMTSEPNSNHNNNHNNNNNIYNNNNNNNNNNINNNEVHPSNFYPTPTNSFPQFLNGPPQRRAFEYQPTRHSPQSPHVHPNQIPESRTLNDVCYYPKDNGSCNDNVLVYYYDYSTRQCEIFHYTGCGGNGNKFFSRESCERTCQVEKRPVCEQDSDPGTCNRHIIKYFFNKITRRCEVYTYTGCEGNDNRFDRFDDCLSTCIYKPRSGGVNRINNPMAGGGGGGSRCDQPIDEGACTNWTKKYAYNSKTRTCEPFNYGGCGGNSNNFNDMNSCRSTCVL